MKGVSLLLATAATIQAQALIPRYAHPTEAPAPLPTLFKRGQFAQPCEEVSASWAAGQAKATAPAALIHIPAQVAYECLQSVPLDQKGNVQQIKELKEMVQFQSTLSWLKNGVKNQIEPLDVLGILDQMSHKVQEGGFTSEYEFQLALHLLFNSAQDFHLRWRSDILEPLVFTRLDGWLISLSKDGLSPPQVYFVDDLASPASNASFTPSPIKTINGVDAVQYLYNVSDLTNYHDPDARYNSLFINRPLASMRKGVGNAFFTQSNIYDGPTTELTFYNGTKKSLQNIATIPPQFDFTNVTNGQSFFKAFCQGQPDETQTTATPTPTSSVAPSNATSTPTASPIAFPLDYPYPVFFQDSLAFQGYYMNGSGYDNVAVLAVPAFDPMGKPQGENDNAAVAGFRETQNLLRLFFKQATEKGKTRLVIDLRGNGGGTIDVGFEFFKQLFPNVEPYGASRFRAHDAFKLYTAGVASIATNESLAAALPDTYLEAKISAFNFENMLDVNHQPYKSFSDWYGPQTINGDTFTSTRRYNFSNPLGGHTLPANMTGYPPEPTPPQPFKPENIVLIQDGLCGSTCAIFSELMREQAKVHTVFVGGRPTNGPAQGVGGSKGSQVFPMDLIHVLMQQTQNTTLHLYGPEVQASLNQTAVGVLANPAQLLKRSAHYTAETIAGGVNSLNNLRQGDKSETPLEFVYEAADCRLFDTLESFFSPVPLWKRVVDAKWGNGKCVEGSMGDKTAISVLDGKPFNSKMSNGTTPPQQQQTNAASAVRMSGVAVVVGALVAAFFL